MMCLPADPSLDFWHALTPDDLHTLGQEVTRYHNIVWITGFWRYVSRKHQLVTTGFGTLDNLLHHRHQDSITFTVLSVQLMRERYTHYCAKGYL